jgi:hypothetical protein
MKHELRLEISGTTGNGTSSRTTIGILFTGLTHDGRTAAPVDCPIDTAASRQRSVRRVDNGIDRLVGNVAPNQFNPTVIYFEIHGNWKMQMENDL